MSDDKLELDIWQALRLIAERTSFQTEEQSNAVLAVIDRHAADEQGEVPTAADLVEEQSVDERDARIAELERQLAERDQAKAADKDAADLDHGGVKATVPEAKFDIGRESAPVKSTPAKKTTGSLNRRRA